MDVSFTRPVQRAGGPKKAKPPPSWTEQVQDDTAKNQKNYRSSQTLAAQNFCGSKLLQLKTFATQNFCNSKLLQLKIYLERSDLANWRKRPKQLGIAKNKKKGWKQHLGRRQRREGLCYEQQVKPGQSLTTIRVPVCCLNAWKPVFARPVRFLT